MTIAVIDQGAELYWFVSNALLQDELTLKHLKTKEAGELFIYQTLPSVVVLNGDDKSIQCETLIGKIRNHVFARNTYFIVVTSDTSLEFKKSLIIAGAGQIFYRGKGHNPSARFFRNTIKWFLNFKTPDPKLFDYKPVPFTYGAEFSTYGRIGWMSNSECFIEVNLDLNVGQSIEIKNQVFDEQDIRDVKITVLEKNKTGRYYQYANGFKCKIESKKPALDIKKLDAWIDSNFEISKHKPIKLVYFEPDSIRREVIKSMIKVNQRYCARGYGNLENLQADLEYQLPHLVLIDRQLILANKTKFEPIKKFIQSHFCYCVTYDNEGLTNIEDFKKDYPFAMHVPKDIEEQLLESMVQKLEAKLLGETDTATPQKVIYFNKYSPYSRMSLHSQCQISELAVSGVGIELPFAMSSYCAFEIIAQGFTHLRLDRSQFFRTFLSKKMTQKIYHQCVFFGQTLSDNELIQIAVEKIKTDGQDKWKSEN